MVRAFLLALSLTMRIVYLAHDVVFESQLVLYRRGPALGGQYVKIIQGFLHLELHLEYMHVCHFSGLCMTI